jgi:multidrug efflux pump subunit AcrA (membrane-fusion protein)
MRFLKQIFLTLVILAAGVAVWVAYVPAALPFLERIGITGVLGIKPQDPATARPGGAPGGRPPSGPVSVVAHEVTTVAYSDQLAAIGDGRATHSVALTPEVSGTIASINVQSGSYVQADSVIATLEN